MQAPRNPLSVLSLAAASACLMIAGVGCKSDVEKADSQVTAAIAQGDMSASSPEELAAAAEKAVAIKNASPEAQVNANIRLASAKTAQAGELLSDIDRAENRIAQLVGELSRTVDVIKGSNALRLAYKKSEPKAALTAVQKAKDAALGTADPVWFKHESGPVPAMSGINKTIADLGTQIQGVEAEIKRLTDERIKAISDGERLGKEAESAENRKTSLDLFTKAEAQRDLSRRNATKVVQQQAKLKMLNEDLERAQAEKKVLTTAVTGLDTQLKQTQARWAGTEADIKQLHELTLALLGNGGASAPAGGATTPEEKTTPDEKSTPDAPAKELAPAAKEPAPAAPDAATEPAPAEPAAPEKAPAPAEEKKEDDAKPAARLPIGSELVRLVSSDVIVLAQVPTSRGGAKAPAKKAPAKAPAAPAAGGDAEAPLPPGTTRPVIAPVSIDVTSKARELSALVAEVQTKRDKVDELLKSAADHYTAAATAGADYSKNIVKLAGKNMSQEIPERLIWANQLEAYNPSSFMLQQASVELMIARLHQSAAEEFAMRGRMVTLLQSALKEAGMTAPGDLNATPLSLTEKASAERTLAEKAYVGADTLIGNIEKANATYPSMQQAQQLARLLKIASYYGQGQLKGQTEPDKVKDLVDQAINEAKGSGDAIGGNASNIALPLIIQDALGIRKAGGGDLSAASTTGPSTGPTSEPTSAPTTGPGSKVFEGSGETGTETTKPATKPDDAAAPEKTGNEPPATTAPKVDEPKPAETPEAAPAAEPPAAK